MTMHRVILALSVAAVSGLAAACGARAERKAPGAGADEKPVTISVAEAATESVERRIDVTGTLAAWEEAVVAVEAEGRLIGVEVDLGDRVRKGQTLAWIVPEEYEWRRAQAEAEFLAAESDLKRVQDLFAKNLAPRQQVDEATRRHDTARAALDLARKKLQDTTLRAPFDGAVARRIVNKGEYVRAGTPAFMIVRTHPLRFRGEVPERYAADVKKGDAVTAHVEGAGGGPRSGKVLRIGPSVETTSRSFPIEAEFGNEDGAVKPGSFARASILTAVSTDAITVPETALFLFAGNPRVYVVEGGRARERVVEPGEKTRDRLVIRKGLRPGEKVAVTAVEMLSDGKAVTVR